jgi:hypothetical protein
VAAALGVPKQVDHRDGDGEQEQQWKRGDTGVHQRGDDHKSQQHDE